MTTCSGLKNEYDRLYRELASNQKEEAYIQNTINRFEKEIKKLERQWKNDSSQREFRNIIEPIAKGLKKLTKIPLGLVTYKNAPSQENNAITYKYIQSLREEAKAYKIRLNKIQTEIKKITIILGRLDAEMNVLKC